MCTKLAGQNIDAPRFFEFNLQSLSATSSPVYGNALLPIEDEPSPNYLFEATLRFPIKLEGKTKLIGQVNVDQEVFYGFWEQDENEIEDIHLYQNDLSVILAHDFNKQWRLYSTFKFGTGSTRAFDWRNDAQVFRHVTLIEKNTGTKKWGIGLAASFQHNLSFLPVLKYEGPISRNWSMDILLPSRLLLRRKLNAFSQLSGGIRASSANYLIGDNTEVNTGYVNTNYRRINLKAVLGYERQISRWIGLRGEIGANLPYRSGLYALDQPTVELHNFGRRVSPHVSFGFFLSLPK